MNTENLLKILPKIITNAPQIIEGVSNQVKMHYGTLLEDEQEEIIRRRLICSQCPLMSDNVRNDESAYISLYNKPYNDKRKPHLASLIVAGQISREDALKELDKPLYDEKELKEDKEYIAKKLGVSDEEFENILQMPSHKYSDFPNMTEKYNRMKKVQNFVSKLLGRKISNYS